MSSANAPHKKEQSFEEWYRNSRAYRRYWIPHGIDQLSIARALYRHRHYAEGVLLDVGCGNKKFEDIYASRVSAYWGLDLFTDEYRALRTVNVYGDAMRLPILDNSVTTVLSIQMLGCLPKPTKLFAEVYRVLKPGGHLILTYSQASPQGAPTDYFRFTEAFYRYAARQHGLNVEVIEPRTGTWGTIGEYITTMTYYRGANKQPSRFIKAVCHILQQCFKALDQAFFDPYGCIGHIIVASKPFAEANR